MNVFGFLRVLFGTARRLRDKNVQADQLSTLAMPELVREWHARLDKPEVWAGSLRAPDVGGVAAAEARLGVVLPEQLRHFYEVCDGVEALSPDYPHPVVRIAELVPTAFHSPSLSAQCEAQWREWGEQDGDPRALRVFPPGFVAAITDRSERELPFSFADALLALEAPRAGTCVAMLVAEEAAYPAGTVFQIENLTATRYDTLATWLATSATLY